MTFEEKIDLGSVEMDDGAGSKGIDSGDKKSVLLVIRSLTKQRSRVIAWDDTYLFGSVSRAEHVGKYSIKR